MANQEQAKKWREEHRDYRKEWYVQNKEKARTYSRKRHYENVTKKRIETALASISEDEWKPISGFESYHINENGEILNKFGKKLKPGKLSNGYSHVSLSNDTIKGKHMYVHQLVWITFKGEIPQGLLVCHKDTDRGNNALDNLCLMTHKENLNKPLTIEHYRRSQILYPRKTTKEKKKVYQYDSEGNLVKVWESVVSTSSGGFTPTSVSMCCLGKRNHHKGFVWSFKEITQ